MIDELFCILSQQSNVDVFLTILSAQASLLGAALVFLGFVQVTLSNLDDERRHTLKFLMNYLSSKVIIQRIRLLVITSILGATTGYIGALFPYVFLEIITGILLLVTLILVGGLAFEIARHILKASEH